jgi:SSS family solute:Na+ symporter
MKSFDLGLLDYLAFGLFIVLLCVVGYISGRGEHASSQDYFLAGNRLPWYVVGGSLVASVFSTDHFIGMVGWTVIFGVSIGMWSWLLVLDISLLIFLWVPFLLASKVTTIPQFLEQRFDGRIRLIFAVVTIVINVFNFMAAVLYTGGLAVEQLFHFNIAYAIIAMGVAAGMWSIYGGLASVAWTDTFTLVFMVSGGAAVVYLALHALAPDSLSSAIHIMLERNRAQTGIWREAVEHHRAVFTGAPGYDRLSVFQPADHLAAPTLGLVLSSFSIGIWYNAMNQFVIQRVLGAKNAYHARLGLVFSGLISVFIPFVIIVPGLVLFALHPEILLHSWGDTQTAADRSYIELIQTVMPVGIRGIFLAALFGAVQSAVNAVLNSTATIFTVDIYQQRINRRATDRQLVRVGIISSAVTLVLAIATGIWVSNTKVSVFYYMQSLNAFFAAPFAAVFMLGVLWRRANAAGAMAALCVGFAAAVFLKFAPDIGIELPRWATTILNQAGLALLVSLIAGIAVSLGSPPPPDSSITENVVFSWSSRVIWDGFGVRLRSHVLTWWLIFVVLIGVVMAIFSPLVMR